jgi:hypothetical protein
MGAPLIPEDDKEFASEHHDAGILACARKPWPDYSLSKGENAQSMPE